MTRKTGLLIGAAAGTAVLLSRRLAKPAPAQSLAGEVVLITGGSRGLGLALAREFAREGCRIALCARDLAELDRTVADLQSRGAQAFAVPCDVRREDEVALLFAAVTEHYGGIDILVNNAGIIDVAPVESLKPEDFRESMETIFWGTVFPTLAALPAFLNRRSGRIVNIASIGGKVSVPHLLPYASAKFAVSGFSQGLTAELRPKGIAVTTIYPGLMRTGSFVQARFKGQQHEEANWFTLGATTPGISMNAARAARQIVEAVKRGNTERTLSLPANLLSAFHKAFPGGSSEILSAVTAALLPKGSGNTNKKSGRQLWSGMNPAIRVLASLGARAMQNYNQKV